MQLVRPPTVIRYYLLIMAEHYSGPCGGGECPTSPSKARGHIWKWSILFDEGHSADGRAAMKAEAAAEAERAIDRALAPKLRCPARAERTASRLSLYSRRFSHCLGGVVLPV
jgi:hypothetical protein